MLHFDAQVVFYETFHTIFPQSVEAEPMISFSTKKTQIAKKQLFVGHTQKKWFMNRRTHLKNIVKQKS